MNCEYQKNKLKRDIQKVKKIIENNESYVQFYERTIAEGRELPTTRQNLVDNQLFLEKMRAELLRLESELKIEMEKEG